MRVPVHAALDDRPPPRRVHADGIKLSGIGARGKGAGKCQICGANRLWATTYRTNVPKWETASGKVIKLLAKTLLSIYFFEENNFVAFATLSHCSENEKPLTPANLPAYSGARW
jgi:hypothetical protein